ncbi:MAG: hypothetical protein HFJ33_05465 [Clostridia bacterium]|nr:hypothetical protein [Clostridia bacterium]
MEENKVENVINIIKDMDIKDKLRLGICLSTSDWNNVLYNKIEMYEKFDTMLKEVDEEYKITLINFAKYKLVMFTMAKIMEMQEVERNKVALYLFNSINICK